MENEQVETMKALEVEMTKNLWGCCVTPGPVGPLTSSKSEGPMGPTTTWWGKASRVIGLFIGTGLLGFWLRVGAALGAKMVNGLEELIRR